MSKPKFEIDGTIAKFVKILEKNNFNIPEIKVEYWDDGKTIYRIIGTGCGKEYFSIEFKCPFNNDPMAPRHIVIPYKKITLFETYKVLYVLYVGEIWDDPLVQYCFRSYTSYTGDKFDGLPKRVLHYETSNNRKSCGAIYMHKTSPYLVNITDDGRHYEAEGNERKWFYTKSILKEFNNFFVEKILEYENYF